MSATAATRTGKVRGALVAVVALLAVAAVFVVWRERRDAARDAANMTPEASHAPTPSGDAPRSARNFRGRFVFVDGEPAASVGFRVEARRADDAPYAVVGRGLSKPDGRFSLALYEDWRPGRPVRLALSDGELLEVDPQAFRLENDVPLEIVVAGARVSLEVVNQRGDPQRDHTLYFEYSDSSGAAAEPLPFGRTDQRGRDYRDFRTPATIVAWAVHSTGTRCTDCVTIAMQPGIRANRATLTGPGLLPPGGLYVTVVDEHDRPFRRAGVELRRGNQTLRSDWFSKSVEVFEHLYPGEYVLRAIQPLRETEHDDLSSPGYAETRLTVEVADTFEDVRVPLARAAILALEVSRTGDVSDLHVYLRLPDERDVPWTLEHGRRPPWRGVSWARFVDATGVVRSADLLERGSFREPGHYWCLAPPGTFEVVFVKPGERLTCYPRGPVELKSERETALAVEF